MVTLKWLCPCSPEVGPQRQCRVAKGLQGAPIVPGKLVRNHFGFVEGLFSLAKLWCVLRFQECKPDEANANH